jgi:tetratricopeptide (TPR) repeat protein
LGAAFELFRVGQYKALTLDVRLILADVIYHQTENQESIDVYTLYSSALNLVPEKTEPLHWQMIGEIALLNNEGREAALAFTRAAILATDSAELWIRAGEIWESVSNWDQAEDAYQKAIKAQPDMMWPRIKLGNIYQFKGQYQDALRLYFQAMDIAPDYSDPYYHLGLTYYLMQEYVQAQHYLEITIGLVPEHASGKFQLAQVMYAQGDLDIAENWLMDAVNNYPEAPLAWWIQLGDWQLEQGDCKSAQATYTHARALGENGQLVEQKLVSASNVCD